MSRTPTPNDQPPRVVLGVTGGVAAYKAISLLRLLMDAGYHVSPVLTPDSLHFVGATTFSALASEPARTSLYGDSTTPSPHTTLGQRADLIVVAPATAHFLARYAHGLANDLLTATVLATRAPVLVFPAMHTEMWEHPSVQENIATLRRRGVLVADPAVGPLAAGDVGAGRLPEPAEMAALIVQVLKGYRGPLAGRRVLISAGGTREAIDPVRVLTNRSSGHQGYALAEVAVRLGAEVTLVTTVTRDLALDVRQRVTVVPVESAADLAAAVLDRQGDVDVIIMAAAVADFTVVPAPTKLKKRDGLPTLTFQPTVDVVATLLERRVAPQRLVAFAAETSDVLANAQRKLDDKPVDLLVVNDVSAPGAGFATATNRVTFLTPSGDVTMTDTVSKEAIAVAILTRVASMFREGAQ